MLSLFSRWITAAVLAAGTAVLLPLLAETALADYRTTIRLRTDYSFAISEFQPDTRLGGAQLRRGGVVHTIAVHPRNSSEFTVSTHGGLFRSTDGGRTWRNLEGLPTHYTVSVAYNPNDPRMLIASTAEDFHTTSFAGVWVSRDGGETWSQPETGRLTEAGGCAYRSAAFAISFDPSLSRRIFVATNCGIMISEDTGATWRLVVPGAGDARFAAVLALRGNRIIAGGQRGIWYSPDGGGSWTQESRGIPAINANDMHAFAGSPFHSAQVFATSSDLRVYQSTSSGTSWTPIDSPASGGAGCGGTSFVRAVRTPTSDIPEPEGSARRWLTLYFSNRCVVYRKLASSIPGSSFITDFSRPWEEETPCHEDTHDMAFNSSGRPILMSTDGGVETRTGPAPEHHCRGTRWVLTGGVQNGLTALEIPSVSGQEILDERGRFVRYDLYFATMHNDLWASTNNGATWEARDQFEGGAFHMYRRIEEDQSRVTYYICAGCRNKRATAAFATINFWSNPNTPSWGTPVLAPIDSDGVGAGNYVQHGYTGAATAPTAHGLYLTRTAGDAWALIVRVTPDFAGPPVAVGGADPVIYQGVKRPFTIPAYRLVQVSSLLSSSPRLASPSMYYADPCVPGLITAQRVSLAYFGADFHWLPIFAVDPINPNHVIGVDERSQYVVETFDGGQCWQPMKQLTRLVTAFGEYKVSYNRGRNPDGFEDGIRITSVPVISFNPDSPNLVLVGTEHAGIFFSHDGGGTWRSVPGSSRIPRITAFHWQSDDTVLIGSYGRGLWKLTWTMTTRWELVTDFCRHVQCTTVDLATLRPMSLSDASFDEAMFIFNGEMKDISIKGNQIDSIYTTPGSSHLFFTKSGKPGKLTRRSIRQTSSAEKQRRSSALQEIDPNQIALGVLLEKGQPKALLVATKRATPEPFKAAEIKPPPGNQEGEKDAPSLFLYGGDRLFGYPIFTKPGELVVLGKGFPKERPIEIVVDDKNASRAIQPDSDGSFRVKLAVGPQLGKHVVSVRQTEGQKSQIASAFYVVKPFDGDEDEEKRDLPVEDVSPPKAEGEAVPDVDTSPPKEEGEAVPDVDISPPQAGGEAVPQEGTFKISIAVQHYKTTPAIDAENRNVVDRENPQADFWLKSDDLNSRSANYSIEGLNGAVVAPKFAGQSPMSVPPESYGPVGTGVAQDLFIPCKTRSGRYCELSAHYDPTTEGAELTVTVRLYHYDQ